MSPGPLPVGTVVDYRGSQAHGRPLPVTQYIPHADECEARP